MPRIITSKNLVFSGLIGAVTALTACSGHTGGRYGAAQMGAQNCAPQPTKCTSNARYGAASCAPVMLEHCGYTESWHAYQYVPQYVQAPPLRPAPQPPIYEPIAEPIPEPAPEYVPEPAPMPLPEPMPAPEPYIPPAVLEYPEPPAYVPPAPVLRK